MGISQMLMKLAEGMATSCWIFGITLLFSLPLGMVIAFGRMSKKRIVQGITKIYISIMRGTPLMLQLMVVYFGPYYLFGIKISPFYRNIAVVIGFVLNYAAYFAEIYRSGIESMPVGQYEAAEILGYSKSQTFLHIVLPLIAPTGGIIAILCAINSLKVFDIVKTMTEGGPYYATDVIATYVYRTAFSSEVGMPRLGYASAAALFFGGAVIIVGLLLNVIKGHLQKKAQ